MRKKTFCLYAIFTLLVFAVTPVNASQQNVRGVSEQEAHSLDNIRTVATGALYLPKQVLNVGMKGMEETATFLSNKETIRKIKDILYLYERKLAWFPTVSAGSGFRPSYGGGLYWNDGGVTSVVRGSVHDSHYWTLKGKLKYAHQFEPFLLESSISGLIQDRDDRNYYGLGSDPENDSRNRFINLSDQDYGVFSEQQKKLQWETSIQPNDKISINYLGYYKRRGFEDEGDGSNPLRDIFDLSSVPGFLNGAVTQIYNELAFEYDSRKNSKLLSKGLYAQVYGGYSEGIRSNPADFFRGGLDVAAFIPTITEDRLIVPRLAVDFVEDASSAPIPFTEYPRHHSFRGVSSRHIIASDEVSVAPSVEYQWPISHVLSGHLFVDTLFVGRDLGDVDFGEGLWAVGGAINLHLMKQEFGRFIVAGGSEGFEIGFSIGVPIEKNLREDW